MKSEVLNVQGMSCDHCKMAVTRAVSALTGVAEVDVSLEQARVVVNHDGSVQLDSIRQAIEGQGYQVV